MEMETKGKKRLSLLFIGTDNDADGLSEILAKVSLEAVKMRFKVTSEILHQSEDLLPVESILDCEPLVILAILPLEIKDVEGEENIAAPDGNYWSFLDELLNHLQSLKIYLFWLAPLSWNLNRLGKDERKIVKETLGCFPILFSSEKPKDILKKMIEAAKIIQTR